VRATYRVLAFIIAALVAVQAAAIGYAVFEQLHWIGEGGTLDAASLESGEAAGMGAMIFHAINGATFLLVSLALLVVSFFAKIPKGVRWAVIVLLCTIVQIALGTLSRFLSEVGAIHGAWALVLFGVAVMAAMRARQPAVVEEPASEVKAQVA
jgi:hypothetical protein